MMNAITFFLLCCFGSFAYCAANDGVTVVRAKKMLDVASGAIVDRPVIVISNGVIVEAGSGENVRFPAESDIIDLPDSIVLPGLIDAHVHLAWKGGEGLAGQEESEKTLAAGFTTVRNLGSTGNTDVLLREAIDSNQVKGPRLLISGPALGIKGGVCDQVFAGEGVISTSDQAVEKVQTLVKQGAAVIKFCAGGGVLPSEADQSAVELEESVMAAIVKEAHRHNVKVAAHAQGPAAIMRAVRAGVDSIEHGGLIDEASVKVMKQSKTVLVPTLYRLQHIVAAAEKQGANAANLERLRQSWSRVQENFRRAVSMGVPLVFGTDATVYPHGLNAREFGVLVQLGVTPLEAIRSATIYAAELLGLKGKVGTLNKGAFGDLIAVRQNPLEDITTLEKVVFVMKAGRVEFSDLPAAQQR